MNKKEFTELQNQFISKMSDYENLCKECYQADLRYYACFGDEIIEEYKLTVENNLMQQVIVALNEKKGLAVVEKLIKDVTLEANKNIVAFSNKKLKGKVVAGKINDMSLEDKENLKDIFFNYLKENHPAVKMAVLKPEGDLYNQLRELYFEDNLLGFQEVLELNKNALSRLEIAESDFNRYSEYYYKTMEMINVDTYKRTTSYPYNRVEVFADKMTIAAELADIKTKISTLKVMNSTLHKDVIEAYGEDINI